MMAHTTAPFRSFWRLISKKSTLYTEMVVADKIVQAYTENDHYLLDKLLGFNNEVEHPITLQLGGNNVDTLRKAAEIAHNIFSYQSINLNCGCPSNTIASSNSMGAYMMYDSELTAQCCAAMKSITTTTSSSSTTNNHLSSIQVSVKCRTGIDRLDEYEDLYKFIDTVSSKGGVKTFQIHARKALLGT